MITTIPFMATVADLQRGYRALVEKIKETGEPLVVVNNGKPDVVVVDAKTYNARSERLRELEEEYLLNLAKEAMEDYKNGKTVRMRKNETFLELLKRTDEN